MIIIGGIIGEVANNGIVESRQFQVACGDHKTPAEMMRIVVYEKDNTPNPHYSCTRCYQVVSEDEVNDIYKEHKMEEERKKSLKSTIV